MANFTLDSGNNKQPGTAYADLIEGLDGNDTLSGFDGDDVLLGGNGLDSLDGGVGADTLWGGTGGDVLLGNSDDDLLLGEDGNDTLDGGNGADTLNGGVGGDVMTGAQGNDTFFVENLADRISEADDETGQDTVYSLISYALPERIEHLTLQGKEAINGLGNALANRLTGNDAANRLEGGDGFDTLIGGAGADTLDGGIGVDNLMGGDGDDLYIVSSAEDKITETEGGGDNDEIQSSVNFSLIDYLENLTLTGLAPLRGIGNKLANILTGNAGNNNLSGEAGDDSLDGGDGADILTGGQGNDRIDGGSGNDTVMYGGRISGYSVSRLSDGLTWLVQDINPKDGDDGTDVLTNLERITFADVLRSPSDFLSLLPTLSIGNLTRAEGTGKTNTPFKFPVTLSAPATTQVTVNYRLSSDTAKAGTDFLNKKGSLTFSPGETRKFISVAVKADDQAEADETFNVQLLKPLGATLAQSSATGTIQNDDVASTTRLPQVTVQGVTLNEGQTGASLVTLTLTLSKPASDIVTLNYTTLDGTATAGTDYLATTNLVSFTPGQTTASIKIPVLGDTRVEPDESFRVQFGAPVNAELSPGAAMTTINITNDDQPTVALRGVSVMEGDTGTSTALLPISLSTTSNLTVTVDYATQDGTAQAGSDYTPVQGTVSFAPGETSQVIRVPILGDSQVETDEAFEVQLVGVRYALLDATASTATVQVNNNDLPQLAISGTSLVEGNAGTTEAILRVSLSAATSQTVTVDYTTRDGTALAGSDFTLTRGSLRFAPGETSQTIRVPINGDTVAEPDESFSVVLSKSANALINSTQDSAQIALTNDDLPLIHIASLSEPEGNDAARYITLEISLSAASKQIISVNYATEDGTASAGSDYLPIDGSIAFSPGQTRQTLNIPILGDTQREADESFRVRLSSPVNAWLDSRDNATITLTDDDGGARSRTVDIVGQTSVTSGEWWHWPS